LRVINSTRAFSTLMTILLLIISAILGGIISYMFTMPSFLNMPQGTTLAITGVYFDTGNMTAFKVGILNPSYSSGNATLSGIAVSLKGESQLYDIVETTPSIQNETVLQKGEFVNMTCSKVRKDSVDMTWGRFAGEYGNQIVVVHVFSPDSPAANKEEKLPFVKLQMSSVFDPTVSFTNFSITMWTDANSEINLTLNEILIPGINDFRLEQPQLPFLLGKETVLFNCTGNWHGLKETSIMVTTEEGYAFSENVTLVQTYAEIQNATFSEDYPDSFNVSVSNLAESANFVNVTKIVCELENGTDVPCDYPLVGVSPNSTEVFTFNWTWTEYRGKSVMLTAYLLQDFQTDPLNVTTPSPVIITVLNEQEVFSLQDRTHFNITLQNHQSSVDAVNITKIEVKETSTEINVTDPQLPYGPIDKGQNQTFYCNMTDWTERAGENLTLIIHVATNQTSGDYAGNYTFEFVFTLPFAELNITEIQEAPTEIGVAKYLNITVENLGYSIWNLTIAKVTIKLQNQTTPLENIFPANQTIIKPGETAMLMCLFAWDEHSGEDIIVTVITSEGVEASQTFHIS
jgi:hypothetical protein